jgi:ATP-dependent exoDNAse (exonuclease V) alpha subunit
METADNREKEKTSGSHIEVEGSFKLALELMEHTNKNLFITGKAGTGKSTLLQYFRDTTSKNVAVIAPTGVAALNVKGQTIHSFFGFGPDTTIDSVRKLSERRAQKYKKLDAIIIDEISMVRADLLDCIDHFMRLNGKDGKAPFGGIQMIFIGDLYQLPPIVTYREGKMFREHYKSEYFFDAYAFNGFDAEFVELDKYYRHSDSHFIELLNAIRNNTASEAHFKALNKRVDSAFNPAVSEGYVTLVTTNALAERINSSSLAKLGGKAHTYTAEFEGKFERGYMPAEEELTIKIGSQIMLLNNDKYKRWVNGSVGSVTAIEKGSYGDDQILVKLLDGSEVEVDRYTWELYQFAYDSKSKSLTPELVGRFMQYPIMLAWAVTVHKSQGKTFDKVIVDVSSGVFANGQLYVALSRCRSLEGIVLRKKLEKKHVMTDWRVIKFLTRYQYGRSDRKMPLEKKVNVIKSAIREGKRLEIVYLKASDEKSKRVVKPSKVGKFQYLDREYLGMQGFDSLRQEDRNFRVDRILELRSID